MAERRRLRPGPQPPAAAPPTTHHPPGRRHHPPHLLAERPADRRSPPGRGSPGPGRTGRWGRAGASSSARQARLRPPAGQSSTPCCPGMAATIRRAPRRMKLARKGRGVAQAQHVQAPASPHASPDLAGEQARAPRAPRRGGVEGSESPRTSRRMGSGATHQTADRKRRRARSMSGASTVHQFACLSDNYGFLVRDGRPARSPASTPPTPRPSCAELAKPGWTLDLILNTHWHPDHAGGNDAAEGRDRLRDRRPGRRSTRIAPLDREVADGDTVDAGRDPLRGDRVGGHTLGHIAYLRRRRPRRPSSATPCSRSAAAGCSRATPAMMWGSLSSAWRPCRTRPGSTAPTNTRPPTPASPCRWTTTRRWPSARRGDVRGPRARRVGRCPPPSAWKRPPTPSCAPRCWPGAWAWRGAPDHEAFGAVRAAKDSFK